MAADSYQKEFAGWAERTPPCYGGGRVEEADLEHIAEEIAAMAKRERRAPVGAADRAPVEMAGAAGPPLPELAAHDHWAARGVAKPVERQPEPGAGIGQARSGRRFRAVRAAAIETGLGEPAFPGEWPYGVERLLDDEFWPG